MVLILNDLNLPGVEPLQHFLLRPGNPIPSTDHADLPFQQCTTYTIVVAPLDDGSIGILEQRQYNEVAVIL